MKITKKEDFSLIFMGILAKNYPGKYLSLTNISSQSNLPGLFLKHITRELLRKKLIISREGIAGGYKLARDPKDIKISQILGDNSQASIMTPCIGKNCRVNKNSCICNKFWYRLNQKLTLYLQNIPLSEFIKA